MPLPYRRTPPGDSALSIGCFAQSLCWGNFPQTMSVSIQRQQVVLANQKPVADHRQMIGARIILRSLPLFLVLSLGLSRCKGEQEKLTLEERWQGCDIFLAPSTTGWGVFAARDFGEGENVHISSLSIPVNDESADGFVKTSVLDDVAYGYGEFSYIVLYGASMLFNHHPEPNILVSRVTGTYFVRMQDFEWSSYLLHHPPLVPISVLSDWQWTGPSKWFSC